MLLSRRVAGQTKDQTVSALQSWISQSPPNFDLMAPMKVRACVALRAVLRSRPRRVATDRRLMRRGAERC